MNHIYTVGLLCFGVDMLLVYAWRSATIVNNALRLRLSRRIAFESSLALASIGTGLLTLVALINWRGGNFAGVNASTNARATLGMLTSAAAIPLSCFGTGKARWLTAVASILTLVLWFAYILSLRSPFM